MIQIEVAINFERYCRPLFAEGGKLFFQTRKTSWEKFEAN